MILQQQQLNTVFLNVVEKLVFTKKSHFIFNGQDYNQIDDGLSFRVVLVNIFTCHFEEKLVLNNNACPSVWFRYVDDTFTLFHNKNTATQFLHYLNNCHANIKFTVEFEENSTTPFLDILIKRHSHTFSSSCNHQHSRILQRNRFTRLGKD